MLKSITEKVLFLFYWRKLRELAKIFSRAGICENHQKSFRLKVDSFSANRQLTNIPKTCSTGLFSATLVSKPLHPINPHKSRLLRRPQMLTEATKYHQPTRLSIDSKSVDGQPSVGSNPTRCATAWPPRPTLPGPLLRGGLTFV